MTAKLKRNLYVGPVNIFLFFDTAESWMVDNIHTGMSEWEKYTCVRFREAKAQDPDYVSIERGEG